MTVYLTDSSKARSAATRLSSMLNDHCPSVVGMATAFLSLGGAKEYDRLCRECDTNTSRVVVGLAGGVTHPQAIEHLADRQHAVRLGAFQGGIFHPKLLVGGGRFAKSGGVQPAICGYVGSANFTGAGLFRNLEVLMVTADAAQTLHISDAFSEIWSTSVELTAARLNAYKQVFASAQHRRSLADLELLEVVEHPRQTPHTRAVPLVEPPLATAVWTGLQSFTGEHMFQVEFPRAAGEALRALLGTNSGEVQIDCVDGIPRQMRFRYYTDNGMYRLNVPNSMPLVQWARDNHQGALLVWRDESDGASLNAEIVRGRRLAEATARSRALRTFGKTSTREYGWY